VRRRHRGGGVRGRALTAGGALALAGALAACSSASSPTSAASATAAGAPGVSMATSVATSADAWAVLPVSADPAFWQVFARSGNSPTWKLATPPGVADNGGLVVSPGGANSLSVAVRPSQNLLFSPLAATSDGGASWSAGPPLTAAVAASPDAFAADGASLVALLSNGTVEASADSGTTWSVIAKPGAIAASAAAKGCGGAVRVTSVSFGTTSAQLLAGGTCGTSGTTAIFTYSAGTGWQRSTLPAAGQLLRLTAGRALVQGKAGLTVLFGGFGWYAYAPLTGTAQAAAGAWTASAALPASGQVIASGTLASDGEWVLLSGGRAATIGGPGQQWTLLPPVPAKTTVLAAGPDGATDALAVSGTTLTVWRLAPKATVWQKAEAISVPVQFGSSG
jgi:hypothetical protein